MQFMAAKFSCLLSLILLSVAVKQHSYRKSIKVHSFIAFKRNKVYLLLPLIGLISFIVHGAIWIFLVYIGVTSTRCNAKKNSLVDYKIKSPLRFNKNKDLCNEITNDQPIYYILRIFINKLDQILENAETRICLQLQQHLHK